MENKTVFNLYHDSWCGANLGPVVLSLTANEIKSGTHSPTLLASAVFCLPGVYASSFIFCSLNTPKPRLALTGLHNQCESVAQEGLGVIGVVRFAAAPWLIVAIRLRPAVSQSITANEESVWSVKLCVRVELEQ